MPEPGWAEARVATMEPSAMAAENKAKIEVRIDRSLVLGDPTHFDPKDQTDMLHGNFGEDAMKSTTQVGLSVLSSRSSGSAVGVGVGVGEEVLAFRRGEMDTGARVGSADERGTCA